LTDSPEGNRLLWVAAIPRPRGRRHHRARLAALLWHRLLGGACL